MKPLSSPVDAISPAFSRTRTLLTPPGAFPGQRTPFRFWFFLKIALIAALTQGNVYGFFFGIAFEVIAVIIGIAGAASGINLHRKPSMFAVAGGLSPAALLVIAIGTFISLALGLFFLWIWCRLRFTLFDLVLYRRGLVGPAWSPYRTPASRFLGLMLLISLTLLILAGVTAGPLVLHLIVTLRHLPPGQIDNNPGLLMAHIFPIYGIMILLALVAALLNAVAQDFILPPLALENISLASAFSRFFALMREHFWHVVLYMIFRLGLVLGLSWAGGLVIILVLLILGIGGAGIGFFLYHALWHAGPAGVTIFVLFCIVAVLVLIAAYALLVIALYGIMAIVKQAYADYFYGSHYPELGNRLDPPLPVPPLPPPPIPYPAAP